ncbi:MAG: sialidase family protein, partial [bacterium]
MKRGFLFLFSVVWLLFLATCGRQDSPSCSGKLYNSPSIYVAGTYVYTSIYAKNKSLDPSDPTCPTNTEPYNLVFGKSTDSGNTWTTVTVKQNISPSSEPIGLSSQAIAADPNNSSRVYISYIDSNNILYCASSADGGSSWTFSRVENTTNTTVVDHAIITNSSGGVHIVYTAINAGLATLKSAKSTDFGATWTLNTIDPSSNTGYKPSLTIDSNNYLYVSYYYVDTNGGLKFARSTDLGSNWSPVAVKTADGTVSGPFSSVAVSSSAIYIAFYNPGGYVVISGGYTENKNGKIQIMKSTNGGSSFSSLIDIDTNSYSGKNMSLVSDGANNLYTSY